MQSRVDKTASLESKQTKSSQASQLLQSQATDRAKKQAESQADFDSLLSVAAQPQAVVQDPKALGLGGALNAQSQGEFAAVSDEVSHAGIQKNTNQAKLGDPLTLERPLASGLQLGSIDSNSGGATQAHIAPAVDDRLATGGQAKSESIAHGEGNHHLFFDQKNIDLSAQALGPRDLSRGESARSGRSSEATDANQTRESLAGVLDRMNSLQRRRLDFIDAGPLQSSMTDAAIQMEKDLNDPSSFDFGIHPDSDPDLDTSVELSQSRSSLSLASSQVLGDEFAKIKSQVADSKRPVDLSLGTQLGGVLGHQADQIEPKEANNVLRDFGGLAIQSGEMMGGLNIQNSSLTGSNLGARVPGQMTAQVTTGAGATDRIATESLMRMSGKISSFAANGGGVMHVRLRPESLGELSIRISTRGGRVEVDFQASDAKAKSIIEESLHYLKESLSAQKLAVNQFDFTVGVHSREGNALDLAQNQTHQGEMNFDLNQGRHPGEDRRESFNSGFDQSTRRGSEQGGPSATRRVGLAPGIAQTMASRYTSGDARPRLDVTA